MEQVKLEVTRQLIASQLEMWRTTLENARISTEEAEAAIACLEKMLAELPKEPKGVHTITLMPTQTVMVTIAIRPIRLMLYG